MFPLSSVLFPEAGLPLHVFEERYRALMARCLEADGEFGVVLIARGSEVGGGDLRVDVGTVARIANVAELEDGRLLVVATGVRRIRVETWLPDEPVSAGRGRGPARPVGRLRATPCWRRPRRRSVGCGRCCPNWGTCPPFPTACASPATPADVGWQLCDMAPLVSLDLQRLLRPSTSSPPHGLLVELCDAMAADVVGLLSGRRIGVAADGAERRGADRRRAQGTSRWTRNAVIPSASPWAACWRHAGDSMRAVSAAFACWRTRSAPWARSRG